MTVYTCNLLALHVPSGEYRARLWADDECELIAAATAAGARVEDIQEGTTFFNFLVTPLQQALALADGAQLTDYQGPRYWVAQRSGDTELVRVIDEGREHVRTLVEKHRESQAMYGRLSRRDVDPAEAA